MLWKSKRVNSFLADRKRSPRGFGMPHIEAVSSIEEDEQTYEVRSDGKLISCLDR